MSRMSLARLRGMTRDEVAWRTRQMARIATQRLSARLRPSRWRREDLRSVLAPGVLDDTTWGQTLGPTPESGWHAAQAELLRVLRARTTRFALDPARQSELRTAVLQRWPRSAADAGAHADRLLAGRYDLLGYRDLACGSPGGALDWHLDPVHDRRAPLAFWADVPYLDPALGDHKIIWEINRHQHWLRLGRAWWLTGDPRCRRAIIDQLHDWLAANPPLVGINWASMLEIALRAISWTWGLHFLLAPSEGIGDRGWGIPGDQGSGIVGVEGALDPRPPIPDPQNERPWLVDMFVALDRQLTHVEQNLSVYFSPNTHLIGEALALYVVGVALPELAASSRWADTGRRILLEEIDRQIHGDGGHAERSAHYQRYTLDFYLLALITATRDGDNEAATRFGEAAARLATFTQTIADDSGRLPLIGDDDGGMLWPLTGRPCHDVRDSLTLAAVLLDRSALAPWGVQEEVFWLAGRRALEYGAANATSIGTAHLPSRTLADTGYVVVRDPSGSHAVFDAGQHGFMNGGHAHADALSITLTLDGRPLLVDPGTSTYTVDARVRDRLRSSMSHNTVTIDERSQAVPSGPFHWQTRVDASLAGCCHNPAFDWAEAFHDAYAPLRHRRTLLRTAESGWLVIDEVLGIGGVTASTHWHFDPAWTLNFDVPGRLKATHLEDDAAWLLYDGGDVWLAHGDEATGLGWYAPVYGMLQPTWAARVTRRASAPFVSLTWLAAARRASRASPILERVVPAADPGGAAIAARVIEADRSAVFLLRPGEPASRDSRACGVLAYQTDARLLHYAEAGRLLTLDLVDASHALALRDGWISVAASEPLRDLHVAFTDDTLDMQASVPPPQLRLQGAALAPIRRIRLNGRELPVPVFRHPDTLTFDGVDWSSPVDQLREGAPFAALP